jgi:hypothetical protein
VEGAFPAAAAAPLSPYPHSSFQLLWFEGITDREFGEACQAIGLNPTWVGNNNGGWRTYAWRDLKRHFGEKGVNKITEYFKVNMAGMRGGLTVLQVVEYHRACCEEGGGSAQRAGGASAAEAARPDFDLGVSVLAIF